MTSSTVIRSARLLAALMVSSGAYAQVPTYSLKLVEVNSIPIVGHGVTAFTVAPGDQLTAKIYLRDWSPDGQMAAAVQAELDSSSFDSGTSGTIRPVGYETTTLRGEANNANAFFTSSDPQFIHYGKQTVSFVDSTKVVPGYRWISVAFGKVGPISKQDGTEAYIGTVKLAVSKDAAGTFTLNLTGGSDHCGILDFSGQGVGQIDVEGMTLTVGKTRTRCWIASSNPQCDSVDARTPTRQAPGLDRISLRMSDDASAVTASDFEITSTHGQAPRIKRLSAKGKHVMLMLDRPLPAEAWTLVTHTPSGTSTRLGRFYGDVNRDTTCDSQDLSDFLARLNRQGTAPLRSGDLDGNGAVNAQDILLLLSLIDAP